MKRKTSNPDIVVRQEHYMTHDMWNQCCCVLSSYADQVDMGKFCDLNLMGQKLHDWHNNIVFTANMSTQVVGFLVGNLDLDCGKVYASVDWFFLDGLVRNRGVGSVMLQNFEKYVRINHNAAGVGLMPLRGAVGFYSHHGYVPSNQDARYFNKYFRAIVR